MDHRTYITIKATQVDAVDYDEVNENKDTLRYSIDKSEFLVKWEEEDGESETPASIVAIPSGDKSSEMDHAQGLVLMDTPEWTTPPE